MLDSTEAKYQTLGAPDPWADCPSLLGAATARRQQRIRKQLELGLENDTTSTAETDGAIARRAICTSFRIGLQQCDWLPLG